jgi:ketosteroid isomerase-like protein
MKSITPRHGAAPTPDTPASFVKRYLEAVGNAATGPKLAVFFDPELVQEEFPSRIAPAGSTRDLKTVLEVAERDKKLMKSQTFEVKTLMAGGDRIAIEIAWTGTLGAALGTIAAATELKARIAMFIEMRNGRILRQRSYAAYEP